MGARAGRGAARACAAAARARRVDLAGHEEPAIRAVLAGRDRERPEPYGGARRHPHAELQHVGLVQARAGPVPRAVPRRPGPERGLDPALAEDHQDPVGQRRASPVLGGAPAHRLLSEGRSHRDQALARHRRVPVEAGRGGGVDRRAAPGDAPPAREGLRVLARRGRVRALGSAPGRAAHAGLRRPARGPARLRLRRSAHKGTDAGGRALRAPAGGEVRRVCVAPDRPRGGAGDPDGLLGDEGSARAGRRGAAEAPRRAGPGPGPGGNHAARGVPEPRRQPSLDDPGGPGGAEAQAGGGGAEPGRAPPRLPALRSHLHGRRRLRARASRGDHRAGGSDRGRYPRGRRRLVGRGAPAARRASSTR